MPVISRFYGIVIRMFFDDHNPPHIHIEYQNYEAIVNIEDGTVKGEMPRRAINMVFDWMDLHKDELYDNWKSIKETGKFQKIKPLK